MDCLLLDLSDFDLKIPRLLVPPGLDLSSRSKSSGHRSRAVVAHTFNVGEGGRHKHSPHASDPHAPDPLVNAPDHLFEVAHLAMGSKWSCCRVKQDTHYMNGSSP